ncbi:MAG TPA: hypothetical protein VED16_00930 [Candidatus Acidoferrum sp.]|nr:hypothetical protein [Candidatus Acidoferrum sp.]
MAGHGQLDVLVGLALEEELKARAIESGISNVLIVCYGQNPYCHKKNTWL